MTVRCTPEEAARTRQAVVDAARRLFARDGYAATPTTDVVAAAGVTRGALYHHFADKADLFREVFTGVSDELNSFVVARATREQDPLAAFLMGCRAAVEFMSRPDYRQIAVVDAPGVLGVDEWHEVDAAIGLSLMELGLRMLADAGRLLAPPTRALAILLFGALTDAGLAVARGEADLDEIMESFSGVVRRLGPEA